MHTIFWLENLKGRDHLKDIVAEGQIILEWILGKYGGNVWNGFVWLRTGTSKGSL